MISRGCSVARCAKSAEYVIEWYGLNQYGERPLVADDRSVCDEFGHLVEASRHESYGGFPDGIVDAKTLEVEQPELLENVVAAMQKTN